MRQDAQLVGLLNRAFPGCVVERCEELSGGISARAMVVALTLSDASKKKVVVRRPSASSPEEARKVVEREYALLSRLAPRGFPAPKPCFLDSEERALIVDYIDGAPSFAPIDLPDMLGQMAAQLAALHRIPITSEFEFLERRQKGATESVLQPPKQLDLDLNEDRVRSVLGALWPPHPYNEEVLLHGDYWPGNLLFRDGRLVAVLDWEESVLGDPLADLSVSRLDILWAFGEPAMHAFTAAYRAQTDIDWRNLPLWDLCSALRPMSQLSVWAGAYIGAPISRPDITPASMRDGHRRFVRQALREVDQGD